MILSFHQISWAMFTLYWIGFCSVSKVAPAQCEQELMFCCGVEIAPKRQVQTPTPQVNQPTNQNTSQRPTNPTYAEISTAQQGGETAQTQTENQTQKN